MIEFEIQRTIAQIGSSGKALTVTRWGDHPAKLDLRSWVDGKPGKGMTLTDTEAWEPHRALEVYLNGEPQTV